MKALNEFLNENKKVHNEIESFLKTRFKKVSKTTNSGVTDFYCDKPKINNPYWEGILKVVVGRDGLSSIEGMEPEVFTKDELFKEITQITSGNFFQESANEAQELIVLDERPYGKKGIIIMVSDGSSTVSAIFKDKKNANKYNRNKPEDIATLYKLAKETKFPKSID